MEVHHHPHLEHREKPWKEYLLEGLMIFLAVSMGFIAENIREHLTEQKKKKELLEVVALDFERDIKQLEFHKEFALHKIRQCDSLINLLDQNNAAVQNSDFNNLLLFMQGWWIFNSNNKSRIEADSKGYLSSIENAELASAILKYDFFNVDYKSAQDGELNVMQDFFKNLSKLTNHYEYDKATSIFMHTMKRFNSQKKGVNMIQEQDIIQAKFLITGIKGFNYAYVGDIDSMKVYAQKSILNIKKEYK